MWTNRECGAGAPGQAVVRGAGGAPWRCIFAWATAGATLVLLCAGGVVTSRGAGMAVPDWPTTFGYNMFFFPWSRMVGGVLYEHTHRLLGALVGALAVGLMVWIWAAEPRRWVRGAAAGAVILVVAQGVLGGLRVVWGEARLGILHAVAGQFFFVLVSAIAMWSSGYWGRVESAAGSDDGHRLCRLWRVVLALIAVLAAQLVLGAVMRHAHRGLSIPDFPLAYGRLWPALDAAGMEAINAARATVGLPSTTPGLILCQLAHRALAVVAMGAAAVVWVRARRLRGEAGVRWWGGAVLVLAATQFLLGVWTVWSDKAADVATAHVAVGSLLLLVASLAGIVVWRLRQGTEGRPGAQGGLAA